MGAITIYDSNTFGMARESICNRGIIKATHRCLWGLRGNVSYHEDYNSSDTWSTLRKVSFYSHDFKSCCFKMRYFSFRSFHALVNFQREIA